MAARPADAPAIAAAATLPRFPRPPYHPGMNHVDLIERRRPWLRDLPLRAGLTGGPSRPDTVMLERIVAAYRRASDRERDRGVVRSGPWQRIRSGHMGELIALLEAGHPQPLADYLGELPRRHAGHGFFQGKPTYDATMADAVAQRRRLVWIMDSVCGLAESLGLLGVDCPEAQPTIPVAPPSADELVDRIEAATGLPLGVPHVCAGLFGMAVGDRVVHVRSACAVYAAGRIREWLDERTGKGLADCRIGEIGPGIGLVPILLAGLGARHLTLIDLPELNAMQAFFLSQALPTHRLVLCGEECPAELPAVRIMPDFEFLDGPVVEVDLLFNQDSLPELDLDTVRRYLERIPRSAGHFLSINQETRVPEGTPLAGGFLPSLLRQATGYRRLARVPAWCRAGYLEEMFACDAGGPR